MRILQYTNAEDRIKASQLQQTRPIETEMINRFFPPAGECGAIIGALELDVRKLAVRLNFC